MAFSAHHKGLPPRSNGPNEPTRLAVSSSTSFSPYQQPQQQHHASPRTTKFALAMKKVVATANSNATSTSPKRPMSASRVQPMAASISNSIGGGGGSSNPYSPGYSPSQTRPASASRARLSTESLLHQPHPLVALDTISFPSQRTDKSAPRDRGSKAPPANRVSKAASLPKSPRTIASICQGIRVEAQKPPVPMDPAEKAKLRAFLESWQDEEPSFRSSILFSETTFAQAKGNSAYLEVGHSHGTSAFVYLVDLIWGLSWYTAMVTNWPKPNAFLAAIAYGCLEQLGLFLEKEYPFLIDIITELGTAVYSNFTDLLELQYHQQQQQYHDQQQFQEVNPSFPLIPERNRFLFYFQHGKHWFQDVAEHKHHAETLKFTAVSSKEEIQRLNDKLHAQQSAQTHETLAKNKSPAPDQNPSSSSSFSAFSGPHSRAGFQFPQLRNMLYCDTGIGHGYRESSSLTAKFDLQPGDYDFWPCCEEILLVFQSLPPKEALNVLSSLMEKSAELGIPMLGETYAVAVDLLDEKERRHFLREYFLLVSSGELQDALQQRDECNDEKRWQLFIDELKERLGLGLDNDSSEDDVTGGAHSATSKLMGPGGAPKSKAEKKLERFHSDEAKVGAKVHEMMELLEDLAAEASFLDEKQSGISRELLKKLREYEEPGKRVEKARELMMKANLSKLHTFDTSGMEHKQCACHCGKHRLVHQDELVAQAPIEIVDQDDSDDAKKDSKSYNNLKPRKSTLKRPLFAKRKNAVNFGNRLSRGSTTQLRLFPLSEVCHMLSAILHLKFSRDATEAAAVYTGSGGRTLDPMSLIMEDRWSFLRRATKPVTFKTLAKDFLTRKYGIKSIAVMHTLQLERSLVYFSMMEKHIRCELFAWFFGADKPRLQSKDYAFQFFQKLLKSIMSLFTTPKQPTSAGGSGNGGGGTQQQLSFATLISVWTEYIGDGESTNSGTTLMRYLTPSHAIDACNLSFPVRIKKSSEYASFLERLYRVGLERDQVELENFLKRAMEVWQTVFDRFVSEIQETLDGWSNDCGNSSNTTNNLDFDTFTNCVARNGMELTGGERLEIFDLLALDDDESATVSRKKLLAFFLEAKYLRANG